MASFIKVIGLIHKGIALIYKHELHRIWATFVIGNESHPEQTVVSYNGVQLVAEELSQMFVTDSHRQLGLLDCGEIKTYVFNPDDNPISTDLYCTFSPYENKCSLALQRDDFAQILAHCNFTFNEPELANRA